jgi:hypothetical protein
LAEEKKMLSDLFHMYQKEVEDGLTLVKTQKIPAGDWKAAEDTLKQCSTTLFMMEQEARSARNAARKDTAMVAVNSLKKEIDSLLDDVRRSSLLNRSRIGSDEEDPETGRLLDTEASEKQTLGRSDRALQNSKKMISEMQDIGAGIQKDLSQQSETIQSVHGKVKNTNSLAGEGRNILRGIEHNEMRNKVCAYGAVVAVFIGIVIAIYWILFRT